MNTKFYILFFFNSVFLLINILDIKQNTSKINKTMCDANYIRHAMFLLQFKVCDYFPIYYLLVFANYKHIACTTNHIDNPKPYTVMRDFACNEQPLTHVAD